MQTENTPFTFPEMPTFEKARMKPFVFSKRKKNKMEKIHLQIQKQEDKMCDYINSLMGECLPDPHKYPLIEHQPRWNEGHTDGKPLAAKIFPDIAKGIALMEAKINQLDEITEHLHDEYRHGRLSERYEGPYFGEEYREEVHECLEVLEEYQTWCWKQKTISDVAMAVKLALRPHINEPGIENNILGFLGITTEEAAAL